MTEWNRSTMYAYLKDTILYRHSIKQGKWYYMEFFRDQNTQERVSIITDWGYIRGVEAIALCTWEIVILSKWSDMKINMNYRDIGKFEVIVEEMEQ